MQSPILYRSSPEGYPWLSRKLGFRLHILVLLCFILNLGVVALCILVQQKKLYITDRPVYTMNGAQSPYYWKSLLPAIGNIIGNINAYIAGGGIAMLVATYAKHQGFNRGLSLKKISHLSQLASAGVPLALSPLFIIGLIVAVSLNLTGTSIVQALTPTLILFDSPGTWPIASFQTVAARNIRCDYRGVEEGFGYGSQCPVNDKYGIMFDAGVAVLSNEVPVNYTRRGVSYPSSLAGLSGRVSTMSADIIAGITGDQAIIPSSETISVSCLPRTKVTVNCQTSLDGSGLSYTDQGTTNTFWFKTQQMQFCDSTGKCNTDYRNDYNDGTVFVFAENRPEQGSTKLLLVATGTYATIMGSPQLYCDVAAQESFVPIRMRGFNAEQANDFKCPTPNAAPDTAEFLTNVTFMAQMVMQKMQGQDGRLEILRLINATEGRTRGEMLAPALERMLEVGATEMYAKLPTDGITIRQTSALQTPRTVLGTRTKYGYLWVIPPAVLCGFFLLGWMAYGFRQAAKAYWSPLDPGCMAVAGVAVPKDSSLFLAVNRLAGASVDHINDCITSPLRLAEVDAGHLALTMEAPDVAPGPKKGRSYGAPLPYTPTSTTAALSPEIKQFTPMLLSPDQTMSQQGSYYGQNNYPANNGYFPPAGGPPVNPTYPAYGA